MKLAPAVLAVAFLAGPALAAPPYGAHADTPDASLPDGACIRVGDIARHTLARDGRTFYVLVSGKGVYRAVGAPSCAVGGPPQGVVVRRPPGYSRACKPSELLIAIKRAGLKPCPIESLYLMHPEEVAALPKGLRP